MRRSDELVGAPMTDAERARILAEADDTISRLDDLKPRQRDAGADWHWWSEPREQPEPEPAYELTDAERAKAASAAWVDFVRAEIRTATMAVATAIGETTRDALAERDQAIEDLQTALAARDRRI